MQRSVVFAAVFAGALGWSSAVFADDHLRGVVMGRNDDGTIAVRLDDASNVTVVLSDITKVKRTDGMREMRVSSAELIPGLRIRGEGSFEAGNRFIADHLQFTRADYKTALAIQSGIGATDKRSVENQQRLDQHNQVLQQHNQALQRQGQALENHAKELTATKEEVQSNAVATSGAIAATNARITNLDDYAPLSSMTVYFSNGSAKVSAKHKAALQQFAAQAKNTTGYVIQIQGFASSVGSEGLNQKLSNQRAEMVAAILSQSGIPPTNMLVPATMGVSEQVATNKTAKGQAENRRAVITLLQNKGIPAPVGR
jgi:outer membrane protein OmpA-like peptidoglycan-associated protein